MLEPFEGIGSRPFRRPGGMSPPAQAAQLLRPEAQNLLCRITGHRGVQGRNPSKTFNLAPLVTELHYREQNLILAKRSQAAEMTKEAYGQAYQTGYALTVRFLLSRGVQRDLASESAQAAWVRGWERVSQLRDENMVLTWVNTIALNIYRRLIRKESPQAPPKFPEKTVGIDMAAIDVAKILTFCRPCDRLLLEQQYLNGVSIGEIARDHGVTQTAIRIRLLRARRDARFQVERRTAPFRPPAVLEMMNCDAA